MSQSSYDSSVLVCGSHGAALGKLYVKRRPSITHENYVNGEL